MAPKLRETFQRNIRRRLVEKGMCQRDFARAMNVSDAQISRILNGSNAPTLETVERIAKVLDTNNLYLLTVVEAESELKPIDTV